MAVGIVWLWLYWMGNGYKRAESTDLVVIPTLQPLDAPTPTPYHVENRVIEMMPTEVPTQQATITPTVTASATITPQPWYENYTPPELKPAQGSTGYIQRARISYYWPPLGGINCDVTPDGMQECEQMATGYYVRDYVGRALACPPEFPDGTQFEILGTLWICLDRGGAITRNEDGSIWLDLLYPYMPFDIPWGSEIDVLVLD